VTKALAASLVGAFAGDAAKAEGLARWLLADAHDLEASLRISKDGSFRGGRMMLERARPEAGRIIAEGLGVAWADEAAALVEACADFGLPMIAGWDVGGSAPVYKLYVNASDASDGQRASLRERLGLSAELPGADIIGLNVGRASLSTKLYVQRPSLEALGVTVDVPTALAEVDGVAWVASHEVVGDATTLRAVFVATKHGHESGAENALATLTGRTWASLEAAFPFPPGPLRQLGWSPSGEVTVYAKERGRAAPVHALAPRAIFRRGDAEVGLYVTPVADTPRAFVRTADHALTFRTREGEPDRGALEALGEWAASCVTAGDDLADPPAGWRRVDE